MKTSAQPTPSDTWLPTTCPDWCADDHLTDLRDGNAPEECREHMSRTRERFLPAGGWETLLRGMPANPEGGWADLPVMDLTVHTWDVRAEYADLTITLRAEDARQLSAHLLELAEALERDTV